MALVLKTSDVKASVGSIPPFPFHKYSKKSIDMGIIINGQNDTIGPVDNSMSLLGTVSIGGTMTIEDFTNIDSVGLVTARNGLHVTGGNVLYGTTTEGYASADNLTVATSGNTGITIRSGTGSLGTIAYSDGTSG